MTSFEKLMDFEDVRNAEIKHMRGLLLWTLYHHQGGSSHIGQPIRRALGIGEHDHLTAEQIAMAKEAATLTPNVELSGSPEAKP